jgi:hypothetical protein
LFPECHRLRPYLSPDLVRGAVAGYILLGLVAAALFWVRRARPALGVFAAATLLGTAIYALDYRLRFNQTMMFTWVVVVFFATTKRRLEALQVLVALFYAWAGLLKLDAEWLSGAALYARPLFVPAALVPLACGYVVVLELVMVWGLFSTRAKWRWAAYAQLLVFHAASWSVVGWFYPLLMVGLTAIYPLVWKLAPERTLTLARLRDEADLRRPLAGVVATFSAFQLVPHLFPGDTALTGEGRIVALHMFDARIECSGGATIWGPDGPRARAALINEHLDARTRCDPIVLLATAQRLCRGLDAKEDHGRVDVAIDAKRATAAAMRPLIRVDDLCTKSLRYSLFRHNRWISPE